MVQGGRSWPLFGEGKSGHICQARICYFRDKCVVFARNCKFANLIQYDMQYTPCNSALLAKKNAVFDPQKTHKKCANRNKS